MAADSLTRGQYLNLIWPDFWIFDVCPSFLRHVTLNLEELGLQEQSTVCPARV